MEPLKIERPIDIELLKNMLVENGISVESDTEKNMGVFENGDPFYTRTIRIVDYIDPEQSVIDILVAEGAIKFKFHTKMTQTAVNVRSATTGRNMQHVYGRMIDPDTFEPYMGKGIQQTHDIIRFATDKDLCVKMTENEVVDFMADKKLPVGHSIEDYIAYPKSVENQLSILYWVTEETKDENTHTMYIEKLPFQLV